MTTQVSDTLLYEGVEHAIIAIEKEWPFKPQDHGLEPVARGSLCWRGYYCNYALCDGELVLDQLHLSLKTEEPPPWHGVTPIHGEFWKFQHMWKYERLGHPMPYTGGLVVGRDFLREFAVNMGFHRAHCYRTVVELMFENGRLKVAVDRSEQCEQARERIRTSAGSPSGQATQEEIASFVEDAFSLSYDKKWS